MKKYWGGAREKERFSKARKHIACHEFKSAILQCISPQGFFKLVQVSLLYLRKNSEADRHVYEHRSHS